MPLKFLTAQDIEQAIDQGITKISLDANTRVTDLARDMALSHGIRLVEAEQDTVPSPSPTSDLHQQVRDAVIARLGMTPAGLDQVIARVLQNLEVHD